MLRIASTVLSPCLLVIASPAQVTPVPGTGCGSTLTFVGGTPSPGQPISLSNAFPCLFRGPAVLAIGAPASTPWPGCSAATCTIGVAPLELTIGGGSIWRTLMIPNSQSLIGACFVAQSGCLAASGCLDLDQAQQICIQ